MKKIVFLQALLITFFANAQNVGIGTLTPLARLHVVDSNVLFSAPGQAPGLPGDPPVSGEGRRLMWYPDKAAFRVGYVNTVNWDKDSIGAYSVALGNNHKASGYASFAAGNTNIASGNESTAIGFFTTASGLVSFATGYSTTSSGLAATAMGYDSKALGNYSAAIGYGTTASNINSIALGYNTTASGYYSTSMGYFTNASGNFSTAIGNNSTASGNNAIAMGINSIASGLISTAIGNNSVANAQYSFAIGDSVIANSWASTSLGRFNNPLVLAPSFGWIPAEPLLIVGNGTGSANKKNAMVLLKDGNLGLGIDNPGATIEIARGTSPLGTVIIHGTTNNSSFNSGTNEDTYIRAGKNNRNVILNDIPGGKVGIGTTNPNAPLAFNNDLGKKISLYESSPTSNYGLSIDYGALQIYSDAAAAKISFGYYSGGVFTEKMYLNNSSGSLVVSGTNYPSDVRYKKLIAPISNPLEKIKNINGVEYYLRTDEFPSKHFDTKLQVGLIAQEVEKVLPQVVQTDKDGYKAVDYAKVVPLLVEGIKEQQKQIDELKKINENLIKEFYEFKKSLQK